MREKSFEVLERAQALILGSQKVKELPREAPRLSTRTAAYFISKPEDKGLAVKALS